MDEDFDDDIIDVVISDTYLGLPVTQIKRGGYHGSEYLTSIWIPKYVYKIDPYAFKNCPNLISIKVDPSNHDFDSRENCNAIIETRTISLIMGCYKSTIPNGVEKICSLAFAETGIEELHIPESVTYIAEDIINYDLDEIYELSVDENNKIYDSRFDCNAIIETATNRVVLEGNLTDLPKGVKSLFDNAENYLKMDSSS